MPHIPPPQINFPITSFEPATTDQAKNNLIDAYYEVSGRQ